MKKYYIIIALFITISTILTSCKPSSAEENPNTNQRINGKGYYIIDGMGYYIVEVDGIEYIATSQGGIYQLPKE